MSPEVIKQSGHGRSSDIWSVGATVIEMVTGKPPWPEFTNNLAALFHVATSKEPPPIPANISIIGGKFIRYLLTHLLTHLPTHSLTYSLTYLLTHLPTHSSKCMVIDPKMRASAASLVTADPFILEEVNKQVVKIPIKPTNAPGKSDEVETSISMRMAYEVALEESL